MGSYANQTHKLSPHTGKVVGIDNCILNEVLGLWQLGIQTVESCCGHNVAPPYIAVVAHDVNRMLDLGYEFAPAIISEGLGIFTPKSVNDDKV
jgi:hypothetical protein